MRTIYKVVTRRVNGSDSAVVQLRTEDKQEAQSYADHLNTLAALSVWIEEEKELT